MNSRPLVLAAAAAVALTLGIAGCTSSSTDSQKSSASNSSKTTAFDWDVAFAGCVRGEGIDYPDPEPGGSGAAQIPVDDQDAFLAAQKKCTDVVSGSKGPRPVSEAERRKTDKWDDIYAKTVDCLRKKGWAVETVAGGWTTKDQIPDADMAECSKDDPSQTVGGAQ